MAIVRKRDLKAMNVSELQKKLEETEQTIIAERASAKSSGRPSNSGRLRQSKRLRARILTFLSQKGEKV